MDKNKMSFRVLALTVTCMLLLSIAAERAIAWPCSPHGMGGCGECETCTETGCEVECVGWDVCCTGSDSYYCCDYYETCCDGTCCNTSTEKCCDDIGGDDDGYCCDSDEACCEGNCCDTANCYACEGGNCVYQCDPDNCEECDGNGNCVDIGCNCTIPGSLQNMLVGTEDDECGNTLTLTFNNNVFCYYYNGLKVGNCPYLGGVNYIIYWKTINGKRFYATYHKSMDDKNDGSSGDEGTKYKYDSVIWMYDCISDTGPSKTAIEHPTIKGGDDGTGSAFEELYCPPI